MVLANLIRHLLTLFGRGTLSALQLQKTAESARLDAVYDDPLLDRISQAGQEGSHTGHVHRDIIAARRAHKLMGKG